MDGNTQRFEFLPAPHPLQDPPPQSIEAKNHHDDGVSLGTEPTHLGQKRLIGRAIIALTGEDILKLWTEHPTVLRRVATALRQLGVQADPLSGLLL
jgi:hypothetical protein